MATIGDAIRRITRVGLGAGGTNHPSSLSPHLAVCATPQKSERRALSGQQHLFLRSRPDVKRVRDDLREEYRQITADLARYDRMRSFSSAGELGAAALGQLGGAVLSPESWLGIGAKGASALSRIVKAGLQQGTVNIGADPIVQGLNIKAGVQQEYEPIRTGVKGVTGAVTGATARLLFEGLSRLGVHVAPSPSPDGATSLTAKEAAAGSRASRAELVATNRAKGLAFEQNEQRLEQQQGTIDLSPQLTFRTPSGVRTRVDLAGRHLPQHDAAASILADDVERALTDIDADHGDFAVEFLRHCVLLCLRCPLASFVCRRGGSTAGPSHSRTLSDQFCCDAQGGFGPLDEMVRLATRLEGYTAVAAWGIRAFTTVFDVIE